MRIIEDVVVVEVEAEFTALSCAGMEAPIEAGTHGSGECLADKVYARASHMLSIDLTSLLPLALASYQVNYHTLEWL